MRGSQAISIRSRPAKAADRALARAVTLIHQVCCMAGSPALMDDIISEIGGSRIGACPAPSDTPAMFEWLVSALSYQGISDQVAETYMERHGRIRWNDLDRTLSRR